MADAQIIEVPQRLTARSLDWAFECFGALKDKKSASPFVGKNLNRVRAFYVGKCAECATVIYLGGSPDDAERVLTWETKSDGHVDFRKKTADGSLTIDVKATYHPQANKLIWPKTLDVDRMAEVLVAGQLVGGSMVWSPRKFEGQRPGPEDVRLWGWVRRDHFIRYASEAEKYNTMKLKAGTRFVMYADLLPMPCLYMDTRVCGECGGQADVIVEGRPLCLVHAPAASRRMMEVVPTGRSKTVTEGRFGRPDGMSV